MTGPVTAETKKLTLALEALPARSRMALLLCREGKSYEQIGTQLEISARRAKLLTERAMEHLLKAVVR